VANSWSAGRISQGGIEANDLAIDGNILVRLLLRYRTHLLAYIIAIVRDEHLAEDVYQDVAALAFERRDQIANEPALIGWLRTASRLQAMAALRRKSGSPRTLDDHVLELLGDDFEALAASPEGDEIDALRRCLATLSPYARQMVDLRYVEGVSGQLLADRLGRKLNTIYVALARIHRALGDCIRKRLAEGGAS
jgi:RNA polymerase sigma-70 factor (ECF subfamily)